MKKIFIISTLLLGFFFLFSSQTAFAQQWSPPTNVSQDSIRSIFGSIAITSNNQAHVLYWSPDRPEGQTIFYSNDSSNWSSSEILSSGGNEPAMAVGPNDTLHAVWGWAGSSNPCTSPDKISYSFKVENTWSSPECLPGHSISPAIAVGEDGIVHIVYSAPGPLSGPDVWHTSRINNQWENPTNLSNITVGNGAAGLPKVTVTNDGTVHAAWWGRPDGCCTANVYHSYKFAQCDTWSNPTNVSLNGPFVGQNTGYLAIAASSDNSVHLVWEDVSGSPGEIFYSSTVSPTPPETCSSTPDPSVWDTPTNISNNTSSSRIPWIASGNDGIVYVVWGDNTGGTNKILYTSKVNGQWSTPTEISNLPFGVGVPRIAVSPNGIVHVVFHTEASPEEIYHVQSPPPDTTPPTITINNPQSFAVLPVGAVVDFTATDASGIASLTTTLSDGTTSQNITSGYVVNQAGVYDLTIQATDNFNNSSSQTIMFVVYDPGGGFVTGAGWIDSPAGAYVQDPLLTGKAVFGFNAKYQNGETVPEGTTHFRINSIGFNFQSTSYEWLVVNGARAQFRGLGTVNGSGNYQFTLTALDGQQLGGDGVDKFRIKIVDLSTNQVVYDNQPGDPDSANPEMQIGAGSIAIQQN
ncbi:MAG TPA: hypothetical protein VIK81_02685 [Patescibacteria group bacterium]